MSTRRLGADTVEEQVRRLLGDEPQRRARVAFARLTEPAHAATWAEIHRYGHVESLTRLVRGHSPLSAAARRRLDDLDLDAQLRAGPLCGARLLIPGDEEWPTLVDELEQPPHCLWVRGSGHLRALTDRAVAVVGSRSASHYGVHVASELGHDLAGRGLTVVSGAAYGIDAAAHRGALAADGPTVAVLACGVDRAYPAAHGDLLQRVAEAGAVVSEVPPGGLPLRSRFLTRNRLIAAMSSGTIVVEAGLRSGSLNTAGWADLLLRPVGAVPGPVTSPASAGTNARLRERGAEVVTDADDVLELVGTMGADLAPERRGNSRPHDEFTAAQLAVWEALSVRAPCTVEHLELAAGLDARTVLSALAVLEILDAARATERGWVRCAATDGAGDSP